MDQKLRNFLQVEYMKSGETTIFNALTAELDELVRLAHIGKECDEQKGKVE